MRTWQSWDFKPTSFKSSIDTRLLIFEEYPNGTFIPHRLSQKLIFSSLDRVWQAGGKYVRLPRASGCNSKRRPISTRSLRELISSFVFPLMFINVPIILSQTIFSTCMTSMQCLTSNLAQYGRSKNMDFFLPNASANNFLLSFPKNEIYLAHTIINLFSS